MANVGGASLGPGSPQPISYGYRPPQLGKPSVSYQPGSGHIDATVGKGADGSSLAVSFQPRPPVHPPGSHGVGDHVDVHA